MLVISGLPIALLATDLAALGTEPAGTGEYNKHYKTGKIEFCCIA